MLSRSRETTSLPRAWRRLATLTLLTALWSTPARADAASPAEAAVAGFLDENVRLRRIEPSRVDRPRILAEAMRRAAGDPELAATKRWLIGELWRLQYGEAPIDAQPDPNVRYHLPFDAKIPRIVSQAAGGTMTHRDVENFNAIDFALPIGTPVLAARAGRVLGVSDGTPVRDRPPAKQDPFNAVTVLHDDGTFALYLHLAPGIPVKVGEVVELGTKLGEAANTGSSSGPHLHFSVARRVGEDRIETIPVRFMLPGGAIVTARERQYLGAPPRPTLKLRLFLEGRPLEDGRLARMQAGGSGQLRVEAVAPDGTARDVTRDPRTEYASMTLWSVDVDAKGRISARPARGFEGGGPGVDRSVGAVAIFYGDRDDLEVGLGKVELQFVP